MGMRIWAQAVLDGLGGGFSQMKTFLGGGFKYFPKQFTVGVPNAVLSVAALAGMLCPPPWSRLSLVSQLVSRLAWLLRPPPRAINNFYADSK